jgi:DNA-binding NarL/FixJ family response regulator
MQEWPSSLTPGTRHGNGDLTVNAASEGKKRVRSEVRPSNVAPPKPMLLVVEDDEVVQHALTRFYGSSCSVTCVETRSSALSLIHSGPSVAGAVIDVRLPDGSGLDVLQHLREANSQCPVLILTAYFEREHAARAQLFGAEFLPKPPGTEHLDAFAARLRRYYGSTAEGQSEFIERYAREHGLTSRQVQVLTYAIADMPRHEMARCLDIDIETVKSHIKIILKKSGGITSFTELIRMLRRQMHEEARRTSR